VFKIYAAVGGAVALISLSCIRVIDVNQPASAPAGEAFEVALLASVDTDSSGAAQGLYYGLLAISLPVGWKVEDTKYAGDVRGKLVRADGEVEPPGPERAGYQWHVFRTKTAWEAHRYMGRTFDVTLKVKSAPGQGVFEIGYVAGAAPAAGRRINSERAEWESGEGPAFVTRWVEVK